MSLETRYNDIARVLGVPVSQDVSPTQEHGNFFKDPGIDSATVIGVPDNDRI